MAMLSFIYARRWIILVFLALISCGCVVGKGKPSTSIDIYPSPRWQTTDSLPDTIRPRNAIVSAILSKNSLFAAIGLVGGWLFHVFRNIRRDQVETKVRVEDSPPEVSESFHAFKQEQEELWQAIHKISEIQTERLTNVENVLESIQSQEPVEGGKVDEDREKMKKDFADLVVRLEALEDKSSIIHTIESELRDVRTELAGWKKDFEELSTKKDAEVLERIRRFGEDIKAVIRSERDRDRGAKSPSKPK